VAAGGGAGQILAKASAADYATLWIDPPAGGGAGADEVQIGASAPADPGIELWVDPAGALAGVLPPGGALNAILAKQSAADYDAQWTSAPILTGLGVTGHVTLNYYAWLKSTNNSGGSFHLISGYADGSLEVGYGLGANRSIHIGSDFVAGATVVVHPPMRLDGTLTVGSTADGLIHARTAVRAFGHILTTDGTGGGPGITSVQLISTGKARVYLDRTYGSTFPLVTKLFGVGFAAGQNTYGQNYVEVMTYDGAGNPQGGWCEVLVMGTL
jgi:hypothetical protein